MLHEAAVNMDEHQDEATPSLSTVANFRDVSRFVKNIKSGLLFRSAQMGEARYGFMAGSRG
jgi:hypothetical protein